MSEYIIPIFKCRLVRDGNIKMPNREAAHAEHCAEIFMKSLANLPHEEMHAIYLNGRFKILGFQVLSVGGASGTSITPGDVFRGALVANARAIVIAHNHPSGDPSPSEEDYETTRAIKKAGQILGVTLLDHIVCCPETNRWRTISV